MKLSAIFESWHIGDDNYPPLHRGQLVNLSFEVESRSIEKTTINSPAELAHIGNAEYRITGEVIRVYGNDDEGEIIIITSNSFRFYLLTHEVDLYHPGDFVKIEGTLLLDHYIWVENLTEYTDSPDLFYNLVVQQIRKVQIPERFINRYRQGKSCPTRLSPGDYTESDTERLETMAGMPFDEEFYIIDFNSEGVEQEEIAITFIRL